MLQSSKFDREIPKERKDELNKSSQRGLPCGSCCSVDLWGDDLRLRFPEEDVARLLY
jgi:hypothetical protein